MMKRLLTIWSIAVFTVVGVLALAEEQPTSPLIENVRLGIDGKGQTRIVMDLDAAPTYVVAPRGGDQPTLIIEVADGRLAVSAPKSAAGKGVIQQVSSEGARVTLALNETALPVRSFVLPPNASNRFHRLVIDVKPAPVTDFRRAVAEAPDLPSDVTPPRAPAAPKKKDAEEAPATPKKAPVLAAKDAQSPDVEDKDDELALPPELLALAEGLPPAPRVKPRKSFAALASGQPLTIVIDPGHGGYDPGAIGTSTGVHEKKLTLLAAKTLAKKLEARGYSVFLTRSDDSFVDLTRRIEFARERQADLFLSIHADANPEPLARGATVYTLAEDRSAKMVNEVRGAGNFKVFDIDMEQQADDVSSILFDLANTDTKNESTRLATTIVTEMRGRVPMVNNTHRRAGLQVLLSPDVPAVLVEMAFLSNKKDEQNLSSAAWRARAMEAVADGIDAYFATRRDPQYSSADVAAGSL